MRKILSILVATILIPSFLYAGTATVGRIGKEDLKLWSGTSQKTFERKSRYGGYDVLNKIGHTVDALLVYGGGTEYTGATIANAFSNIGKTAKVGVELAPGTWIISTARDFSSYTNITLIIPDGAQIRCDADLTLGGPTIAGQGAFSDNGGTADLTINGSFEAGVGVGQVFDWTGSGKVSFGTQVKEVYPEYWGIDGVADEVQINQAILSLHIPTGSDTFPAEAFGGVVWLNGKYTIAAAVEVFEGVMLDGKSKFASWIYNGNTSGDNAVEMLDSGRATGVEFFQGIRNCRISGNASSGHGLYIYQATYATYENMFIHDNGGSGIFIKGVTVGGTFRDIYSYGNGGWGLRIGDTALADQNTVQHFYACQFRVNESGGAFLYKAIGTNLDNCVFESNQGPGLRIEGYQNRISFPYFENNNGGKETIIGATQANPCVITCAASTDLFYQNGDTVVIHSVAGMTELNGNMYTVANKDAVARTFELSGVDSTGYTAYVSGGNVESDQVELTVAVSTCYGNIIDSAYLDSGIIHVEGADYNQIISAKLSSSDPNIIIDNGSAHNQIIQSRIFNIISMTDNGQQTHQADSYVYESDLYSGVNVDVEQGIRARDLITDGDRTAGYAGTILFSNTNEAAGGGATTLPTSDATHGPSDVIGDGWMKVYIGTQKAWIPYWHD